MNGLMTEREWRRQAARAKPPRSVCWGAQCVLPAKRRKKLREDRSFSVFLLLLWCKRLVFYLQLHRLLYEDSITEPQNQIITLFETFRCHPRFVIELCQLVCPLFNILCLLKLFQHTDLLFKRCILRF